MDVSIPGHRVILVQNAGAQLILHQHQLLTFPPLAIYPGFAITIKLNLLFTITTAMNGTSSNSLPFGAIMYLIYHIFLPPKLPRKDDFDLEYETILLDITIDILLKFKGYITYDQSAIIDSVIAMVANLRTVRDSGGTVGAVNEGKLGNALRDLRKKGKYIFHDSYDLFHSF